MGKIINMKNSNKSNAEAIERLFSKKSQIITILIYYEHFLFIQNIIVISYIPKKNVLYSLYYILLCI